MKIALFLCLMLLLPGCRNEPASPPPVESNWTAMGTFATVALPSAERSRLEQADAIARRAIAEVEAEISTFMPASPVSQLNQTAGSGENIPLPPHLVAVFDLSQSAFSASSGAFDPTVGPLMQVWGFRSSSAPIRLPADELLQAAASIVGWDKIVRSGDLARLARPDMRLDFGAVGKGYGVDVAFARLQAAGWQDLMVNLGGNLRCSGAARPGRHGWLVAVRDPFLPYGRGSVGTLPLSDGLATATSGRYEKYVEIGGRRYAHIIDPRNGQPVAGMAQVTVVARTAAEADVLSTSLFVLGIGEGCAMLRQYPGSMALFVPDAPEGAEPQAFATAEFAALLQVDQLWRGRVSTLPPGSGGETGREGSAPGLNSSGPPRR